MYLESDPTVFYRNGVKMIALREEGKENFNEIPYSLYEKNKERRLITIGRLFSIYVYY